MTMTDPTEMRMVAEPQEVRDFLKDEVDGVPVLDFVFARFDEDAKVRLDAPRIDFGVESWFSQVDEETDSLHVRVVLSPSSSLPVQAGFIPSETVLPSAADIAVMNEGAVQVLGAAVGAEWMAAEEMATVVADVVRPNAATLYESMWFMLASAFLLSIHGSVAAVGELSHPAMWDDADEAVRAAVLLEHAVVVPPVLTREDLQALAAAM